jgi:hypothetical protein
LQRKAIPARRADFDAVFHPGGRGPLWDLAGDRHSIALIEGFLAVVWLTDMVPFLVEDEPKARGAVYTRGAACGSYVVQDGLLITGQNLALGSDGGEIAGATGRRRGAVSPRAHGATSSRTMEVDTAIARPLQPSGIVAPPRSAAARRYGAPTPAPHSPAPGPDGRPTRSAMLAKTATTVTRSTSFRRKMTG